MILISSLKELCDKLYRVGYKCIFIKGDNQEKVEFLISLLERVYEHLTHIVNKPIVCSYSLDEWCRYQTDGIILDEVLFEVN